MKLTTSSTIQHWYAKNWTTWQIRERERERARNNGHNIYIHQSSTDIDSMHSMHGTKIFQAEAKVPAAHSRKVANEVCCWELIFECLSKNSSKVVSSLKEWDVVSNCTFGDRYKPPRQSACIKRVEPLRQNGKNYQNISEHLDQARAGTYYLYKMDQNEWQKDLNNKAIQEVTQKRLRDKIWSPTIGTAGAFWGNPPPKIGKS